MITVYNESVALVTTFIAGQTNQPTAPRFCLQTSPLKSLIRTVPLVSGCSVGSVSSVSVVSGVSGSAKTGVEAIIGVNNANIAKIHPNKMLQIRFLIVFSTLIVVFASHTRHYYHYSTHKHFCQDLYRGGGFLF